MQVVVKRGSWPSAPSEVFDERRLSLIGYTDLGWGISFDRYPLPLLTIDSERDVQSIDVGTSSVVRVKGIRPDHREPNTFITGQWEAMIDLPAGQYFGDGSTYVGQGHETTGYIFDENIPFIMDNELAFVREIGDQTSIVDKTILDEQYHLAYAPATVLEGLGKLALD